MITDSLNSKLLGALKQKDSFKTGVIRYLMSGIKNKEIELRPQGISLTDEHILKVISKQIKQRNDSIAEFTKGGRQDLVDKETKERVFLEELYREFGGQPANA